MNLDIYVASSHKNVYQNDVIRLIKKIDEQIAGSWFGVTCYDFKNPPKKEGKFRWEEIDEKWELWTTEPFQRALATKRANEAFQSDFNGMTFASKGVRHNGRRNRIDHRCLCHRLGRLRHHHMAG